MRVRLTHLAPALVLTLLMTGCTNYYRISSPSTGRAYYTTSYHKDRSGAVTFDSHEGSEVTLDESEIKEISQEEFDAAIAAPVEEATEAAEEAAGEAVEETTDAMESSGG